MTLEELFRQPFGSLPELIACRRRPAPATPTCATATCLRTPRRGPPLTAALSPTLSATRVTPSGIDGLSDLSASRQDR